jgi:hypothetical protein
MDSRHSRQRPRFGKAQLQELNNGRLAMMGITGLIAQDGLLRVNM